MLITISVPNNPSTCICNNSFNSMHETRWQDTQIRTFHEIIMKCEDSILQASKIIFQCKSNSFFTTVIKNVIK